MVAPLGLLMPLRVLLTLLRMRLVGILLGWLLSGVPLMSMIGLRLHLWSRITPMFGLMVALSLIRSLVFLLLELGFSLTNLSLFGVIGGGVRFILFALRVSFSPVGVSVLFLGHFNLFRGLKCGESFWLCSLLVLFTLVLTILVLFDMLVGCWMVVVVLSLLSLSMTVISSC